ncbi:helix-turn-helix domain-containing protein [Streptosporangium sp. NPDC002721]|uniref:helix-turn-helix domain-containing protein n=1 Tax=Streptosporangium sp. NPDC002721 TaxID=3366188 RepID=UPI0036C38998
MGTIHPLVAELNAVRVELGVPAEDVAEAVGVAVEEINWWASGLRMPSLGQAIAYGAAIGRQIDFLGDAAPATPEEEAEAETRDVAWLMAVLGARSKALNISQRRLATTLGVGRNTIQRWTSGAWTPSLVNFTAYADAVGWAVGLRQGPPAPVKAVAEPGGVEEDHATAVRVRRPPHRLVVTLEAIRIEQDLPRSVIPRLSSNVLTKASLQRWASGFVTPGLNDLIVYARTLGCDLGVVRPTEAGVAPQVRRRRDILQQIEVERGTRQTQLGGGPFYVDGTGPSWQEMADEAFLRDVEADQGNRLTWALRAQSVLGQVLRRDDPVELRAELVRAAAVLVAWLEDLDARDDQEQDDENA